LNPSWSLERAYLVFLTDSRLSYPDYNSNEQSCSSSRSGGSTALPSASDCDTLDKLKLTFSKNELRGYTDRRAVGLSRQTTNWLRKGAEILWNSTKGELSNTTVDALRQHVLRKYVDVYAKRKVINFSKAFFRYLSKTHFDTRYQA
jgi:hypothetical protein